jgi:carboxyl-terminal processing protease
MSRPRRRWFAALALGVAALGLAPAAQSWRALALQSFDDAWRTIDESFFDPSFGGLDWQAVRSELRPRVEAAESPGDARAVIRDMLGRLKRSHFALLSSSSVDALPGPAVVPIDVRIVAEGVVITRVLNAAAADAGLLPGQVLLAVDGRRVDDPSSADGVDEVTRRLEHWRHVNRLLHGENGSAALLRVRDTDGIQRDRRVLRDRGAGEDVSFGALPLVRVAFDAIDAKTPAGRRAGVIAFSLWMASVGEPIAQAVDRFRQHDGMVLDLRGNPGGLASMMSGVAGHFIAEPVVLGTMRTRQAPLSFRVNPRLVTADGRQVSVYAGKVAILVDELTGSTSETFAGSMQDLGRARVFGRRTMGQALPALTRQLPNGDVLMYAIGDFTTASGRSVEGGGVTPDESIPLSIRALSEGRDEVLAAALRWIDGVKRP